ncbi:hypothetical protein QE410_002105 [Microbacterium sp. SORGH_AS 1204]|uniref:hypothetical protein n=1 Tax=Microbacterium sp. SORGH_AS_1204 TaxID=3041785 RepID=UPI00278F293C|nr:hypothetical protein [Microbacterium sp. SORGH_AS_1204]MDQ1137306.1 hypothetical protein [Microbacterium sp. SORGH_AS_1204]
MVGSDSTFWDSPLFGALLALFGVIAGAVLTFALNHLQDRQRTVRETQIRWDERILEVMSRVMNTVEDYAQTAAVTGPTRHDDHTLFDAHQALARELFALQLIAPPDVRTVASAMAPVMRAVLTASDEGDMMDKVSTLEMQRDRLAEAVRAHFGLQSAQPVS